MKHTRIGKTFAVWMALMHTNDNCGPQTAGILEELVKKAKKSCPDAEIVCGRSGFGKRQPQDIGISAVRLGNEVGTHEIVIAAGSETITLKHEAENRALFARGALAAARFLPGRAPGLYDMRHIIAQEGN